MKTLYLLIIIAGIVISTIFGILVLNHMQQQNQEQNYTIKIVGLKDNYKTNEPIEFTINVQGYGLLCGMINAKILNFTNQHNNSVTTWGEALQCNSDAKPQNFSINIPVTTNSPTKSISLDHEGSYYVVSSFSQFHGLNKTAEREIFVSLSGK